MCRHQYCQCQGEPHKLRLQVFVLADENTNLLYAVSVSCSTDTRPQSARDYTLLVWVSSESEVSDKDDGRFLWCELR